MTVAQDILGAPGSFCANEPAVFVHDGKLDSTYSVKNIWGRVTVPFNPAVASKKSRLFLYGATTPQGDATYASAPAGSEFDLFSITSDAVTEYKKLIKRWTGTYGWGEAWVGSTSSSTTDSSTGTVRTLQSRITYSGASVDAYNGYFLAKATGGSAMVAALRGYGQSGANNTSVSGAELTGEMVSGGATHSNGSIVGSQSMCSVATGLTVSGGAMAALRLSASLASAVTGLQHGGASFIFLTDQNATYKIKYLIDTGSDGSSLLDYGSGTSHLECYESNGMTFTCTGGFRCYSAAAGGDVYIPFGGLAS
jgi:hypothetical protein